MLLENKPVHDGIIHLVRTQNFPKNLHLLPPGTRSENFAYVLNE